MNYVKSNQNKNQNTVIQLEKVHKLVICFDGQIMINLFSNPTPPQLQANPHWILHSKYSHIPRLNYDYCRFSEFTRPISQFQLAIYPQIKCKEFMYLNSHQQYLATYHNLSEIFLEIKDTILKRVNIDDLHPMNCQNQTISFLFTKLKKQMKIYHTKGIKDFKFKNRQKHEVIGNLKSSIKKCQSIEFQNNKKLQDKELSNDNSISVLDKITKDLSFMIKRMNESQLQINLIDYLASLKKYKSTKKREIVFKKRLKQENISSINKNVTIKIQSDDLKKQYENIEKESYGLTKTKRKVSAEAKKKKIHNLNGKTETLRIKITPLSPKLHNSSHYKSLKHNIEEAGKKLIASKRLVKSQDVQEQLKVRSAKRPHSHSKSKSKIKDKSKGKSKEKSKGKSKEKSKGKKKKEKSKSKKKPIYQKKK